MFDTPKGNPYKPTQCASEVFSSVRGVLHHQCNRKAGHGPEGIFCAQHAKRLT